jgi:hypothetical protein
VGSWRAAQGVCDRRHRRDDLIPVTLGRKKSSVSGFFGVDRVASRQLSISQQDTFAYLDISCKWSISRRAGDAHFILCSPSELIVSLHQRLANRFFRGAYNAPSQQL